MRVDDELEMAAGERGIGIGVAGDEDGGDEEGARLIGIKRLLREESGIGVVRFVLRRFLEQVVAGIAERDAEAGVVVDGKFGVAGRVLGRMRETLRRGWSGGWFCGGSR